MLEEGFGILNDVMKKDTATYYLESCLRYVLSVRDDIIEIAEKVSVEGRGLIMTVADKLIQEGMEQAMKRMAKNAIVKGIKLQDILELTGLTESDIEKIKKEMLESRKYFKIQLPPCYEREHPLPSKIDV